MQIYAKLNEIQNYKQTFFHWISEDKTISYIKITMQLGTNIRQSFSTRFMNKIYYRQKTESF